MKFILAALPSLVAIAFASCSKKEDVTKEAFGMFFHRAREAIQEHDGEWLKAAHFVTPLSADGQGRYFKAFLGSLPDSSGFRAIDWYFYSDYPDPLNLGEWQGASAAPRWIVKPDRWIVLQYEIPSQQEPSRTGNAMNAPTLTLNSKRALR